MNKNTPFDHYRQLLQRVDAKFSDIQQKYPEQFACQRRCFGCCRSGLTVTNVEAKHIQDWLMKPENLQVTTKVRTNQKPHGEEFCDFLNTDGECMIYDVRPVVCRSHGAPILVPRDDDPVPNSEIELEGDVCPLNFESSDLAKLPASDWIRLDTLNTILAAIDREFDANKAGTRHSLDAATMIDKI